MLKPVTSISEIIKIIKKLKKENKVNELSKEFKSDKLIKKLSNDDYTTIQLLICHYLGWLENIKGMTNQEKKLLLSVLFKTAGIENIRKKLSYVGGRNSPLSTQTNLEILRDLFEESNAVEPLKKIEADLQKLINKQI